MIHGPFGQPNWSILSAARIHASSRKPSAKVSLWPRRSSATKRNEDDFVSLLVAQFCSTTHERR